MAETDKSSSLPIAVDVMGGDYGPSVAVEGIAQAYRENGIKSLIVGDREQIEKELNNQGLQDQFEIIHAPDVITMEDSPSKAIRSKPNASIIKSYEAARDKKASALISAGNTGAMMVAGLFVSRTLPGIDRPAIATCIPKMHGNGRTVLLDSGANTECHSFQLEQFALMGYAYAKIILEKQNPIVGLLSNGSESSKGTDLIRAVSSSLAKFKNFNFRGFVEGRDIAKDNLDVVVCDGFVGNVVLKSMEGSAELVIQSIKELAKKDLLTKLGMALAKPGLTKLFKEKLDPAAYGGAPLLGLKDVAIVCHGSSKARAFKNAIILADKLARANLVDNLLVALSELDEKTN